MIQNCTFSIKTVRKKKKKNMYESGSNKGNNDAWTLNYKYIKYWYPSYKVIFTKLRYCKILVVSKALRIYRMYDYCINTVLLNACVQHISITLN